MANTTMRPNTRLDSDQKLHKESSSPLQLLQQAGLIGCIEAEPDLSVQYKKYLSESLSDKYSHP
ncbi:hypothetical protein TUMEXPCC7403_04560 [Tumidithrix helvetica PCC 7403]|uniref:hypothetical protein n=1 Tax=Tumidithrix helvetica TaxID=3457545 RepID=UPI003C959B77